MPSTLDYQRLRRDVYATEDELSDAQAEEHFFESAESYTGAASIKAGARVIAILGMLAEARESVDYTQNESSESASQRFKHLQSLLDIWQGILDAALKEEAALFVVSPQPTMSVPLRARW